MNLRGLLLFVLLSACSAEDGAQEDSGLFQRALQAFNFRGALDGTVFAKKKPVPEKAPAAKGKGKGKATKLMEYDTALYERAPSTKESSSGWRLDATALFKSKPTPAPATTKGKGKGKKVLAMSDVSLAARANLRNGESDLDKTTEAKEKKPTPAPATK